MGMYQQEENIMTAFNMAKLSWVYSNCCFSASTDLGFPI